MSGSLMLGFDVQQFCNIDVQLQAIAVCGYTHMQWYTVDRRKYEGRLFSVYIPGGNQKN